MPKGKGYMNGQNIPAVRNIRLHGEDDTTWYVDIGRELSALNNRLYRQGMIYHIGSITMSCRNDFKVKVGTIPNTWAIHGAWKMAFRNWLNSNRERMDDGSLRTVSKIAKWSDFRLAMDRSSTSTDPDKWNLIQLGNDVVSQAVNFADDHISLDEYHLSQYTSTDDADETDGSTTESPDQFTAHVIGSHVGSSGSFDSISILEAFKETLKKVQPLGDLDGDGDLASDDLEIETGVWANLMESHGSTAPVIEHLIDDFNQPPFDGDSFFGWGGNDLETRRSLVIDPTGDAGGQLTVGGFDCPLGMLKIEVEETNGTDHYLDIELIPGSYQGVMAESMGTPKFTNRKTWSVV